MQPTFHNRFAALFIAIGLSFAGCGSPADNQPVADPHAGHTHDDPASQMDEQNKAEFAARIKKNLASLSPEDRASAEKQGLCAMSEMELGSMGPPIKLSLDGQDVWICCEDCREEVTADPAKYLAKLKELN